jgi:glycosyltransferase involved in cell wall biosynthesis
MNEQYMIKVAALTGGRNAPSARFRVRQLISVLQEHGIEMQEFIPPVSRYPPSQHWLRPFWGLAALAGRVPAVIATYRYDIVFLQREILSTFVTLEPLTKHPRVLDVDDAIFLHRGGNFAKKLAKLSDLVICGNDFIAEYFSRWNKNVVVIPTAIDTQRYKPITYNSDLQNKLIIGWTGTSGNFKYLYEIEDALEIVVRKLPNVFLRVIADKEPTFHGILKDRLDFIKWSTGVEVTGVQGMTVGIMPIANTDWARGKCSFKMLQYMACGIPVVVSPVGMNSKVLSLGEVGIGAKSSDEWISALLTLLLDKEKTNRMGAVGRQVVEKYFNVDVIAVLLATQLRQLL